MDQTLAHARAWCLDHRNTVYQSLLTTKRNQSTARTSIAPTSFMNLTNLLISSRICGGLHQPIHNMPHKRSHGGIQIYGHRLQIHLGLYQPRHALSCHNNLKLWSTLWAQSFATEDTRHMFGSDGVPLESSAKTCAALCGVLPDARALWCGMKTRR